MSAIIHAAEFATEAEARAAGRGDAAPTADVYACPLPGGGTVYVWARGDSQALKAVFVRRGFQPKLATAPNKAAKALATITSAPPAPPARFQVSAPPAPGAKILPTAPAAPRFAVAPPPAPSTAAVA